jgi:D-alanyl-D-alanine carboxypeptidase (penicillin-binding protein 5/6)
MLVGAELPVSAAPTETTSVSLNLNCPSAVLMEASTGEVLYAQNPDLVCPPASITKIMTLLLVMEAVDSGALRLDDRVTASAHAASMGGSQVYLKEGERMSVEDMIKSVVISSANDAALALAEHLCGTEEAFVTKMNEKAKDLGMMNTNFENTNGLDDTVSNHVTTARDVAIMSRALIQHELILKYSSIWMDTIRDGAFGLTNTNRLVRFYPGATGLKTGSTARAKFCISATAKRNGMSLICVIMGAETRDIRNEEAKKLLDWGYANFELYTAPQIAFEPLRVLGGAIDYCSPTCASFSCVVKKGMAASVTIEQEIPQEENPCSKVLPFRVNLQTVPTAIM